MSLVTESVVHQFRENGFAIIPNFLSLEEVASLKQATKEMVQEYCQNSPVISVFGNQSRDTYFAESGDKIRGFYEESAVDSNGHLLVANPNDALNKVGHALHYFLPPFKKLTLNDKVKDLVLKLTDIEQPVVIQSMVIFKHPKVGGEVKPHQDATYLFSKPTEGRLIGLWIALDEASLENGCLHFVPGSHKNGKVYQRFVKNLTGKEDQPLFSHRGEDVPKVEKEKLVAAPAKPGDLVLIDGMVIHQSEPNRSDKPRMAYTFHVADGKAEWSEENWLQPTEQGTFVQL